MYIQLVLGVLAVFMQLLYFICAKAVRSYKNAYLIMLFDSFIADTIVNSYIDKWKAKCRPIYVARAAKEARKVMMLMLIFRFPYMISSSVK